MDRIKLRQMREKKGEKQEEIAEILGYADKTGYGRWENGNIDPPLSKVQKLAEHWKLSRKQIIEIFFPVVLDRIGGINHDR